MIHLQSSTANIRKRLLAMTVSLILQRQSKTRKTNKQEKKAEIGAEAKQNQTRNSTFPAARVNN